MRFKSIRLLLAMAGSANCAIRQFDVTSAYLHRPLRERIYMRPPPGLEHPTNHSLVMHMPKSIYSTVQGGEYWGEERDEVMVKTLGWTKRSSDQCMYRKVWGPDNSAVAACWVDDNVSAGSRERLMELEEQFKQRYGVSGSGDLTWTLGIAFTKSATTHTVSMSQEQFILSLVRKFGLQDAAAVSTPMAAGAALSDAQCPVSDEDREDMRGIPYRELVGAPALRDDRHATGHRVYLLRAVQVHEQSGATALGRG